MGLVVGAWGRGGTMARWPEALQLFKEQQKRHLPKNVPVPTLQTPLQGNAGGVEKPPSVARGVHTV